MTASDSEQRAGWAMVSRKANRVKPWTPTFKVTRPGIAANETHQEASTSASVAPTNVT